MIITVPSSDQCAYVVWNLVLSCCKAHACAHLLSNGIQLEGKAPRCGLRIIAYIFPIVNFPLFLHNFDIIVKRAVATSIEGVNGKEGIVIELRLLILMHSASIRNMVGWHYFHVPSPK